MMLDTRFRRFYTFSTYKASIAHIIDKHVIHTNITNSQCMRLIVSKVLGRLPSFEG